MVVACGSVARNEVQQGQVLPAGYDRYSNMQFGNRDFIVNAVLWLTDDSGLIALRRKSIPLRLLNESVLRSDLSLFQAAGIVLPLFILALAALIILLIRKKRYTR